MAAHGQQCGSVRISLPVLLLLFMASAAQAQSVSSGTINGTIRDQSGGVLPGVTATLTSPALQVRELVQVTGAEGEYRFVDCRRNHAEIQLTGFSTLIANLRLTVRFTARIDEHESVRWRSR
jgi:hypothetical protein